MHNKKSPAVSALFPTDNVRGVGNREDVFGGRGANFPPLHAPTLRVNQQERFSVDAEENRPWFPVSEQPGLFGIVVHPAYGNIPLQIAAGVPLQRNGIEIQA